MKKENAAFLIGGFAFGALFGYGVFNAVATQPDPRASQAPASAVAGPSGPSAPTQVGPLGNEGGAPMMAVINDLKRRLQTDPRDGEALTNLAHIYQDAAMCDQAVGYYQRALDVRPNDPDLITDMGICYRALQQFDKALDMFALAQSADPQHWQSLFNTAVVAGFDLGRYDQAFAAVDKLASLDQPPPQLDQLRQALESKRASAPPAG